MKQCAKKGKNRPFWHTVTLSLKNIEKEQLQVDQKHYIEKLRFKKKCKHLLKTSNLGPQCVQIAALLSMLLPKTQFQRGQRK